HALERKQNGRILASPSITTLNGVRGSVFVGDQVAYIHDYTVVNDILDPQIEVLNVGAALDVKPYVSADGKYVTMEFRPAIASYSIFTDVITAQRFTNVVTNNPAVQQQLLGSYPLELPNVTLAEASTTIMVPDKGILLVGGFGHHDDEQNSAKAPVLGHIPYLGRLFGRRGRYSARSQLYLLATVDIINYDEAEAKL
ncbi:MAG TPA: hypothetical protein VL172_04520, partial [Kofleriaceae bacterium]|nr:hypothetical protein [Kofleriaceae bacterium]